MLKTSCRAIWEVQLRIQHTERFVRGILDIRISFKDLLEIFFSAHDPTTLNRQGNDVGTQYRSAIFYTSAIQKEEAEEMIQDLNARNEFSAPIVTEVSEEVPFYHAEKEHSNYFNLNKEQSYCQFVISPKIKKVTAKFNKYISKDE